MVDPISKVGAVNCTQINDVCSTPKKYKNQNIINIIHQLLLRIQENEFNKTETKKEEQIFLRSEIKSTNLESANTTGHKSTAHRNTAWVQASLGTYRHQSFLQQP